jgi:NAD(P)-dependent dehydrogenase (short-subunit alcohol dehydrogenase family)
MLTIDLKDNVTMVIGGARGIGASVVTTAAEAGSHVVWTCLDIAADIEASEALLEETTKLGVKSFYRKVDCTNEPETTMLVKEINEKFWRIDSLVHCAGFTSPVPFLELNATEWRRVIDINLNGAFISVRSVLDTMITAGRGSIVLIGSAAIVAGGGGRADYVSGKSGLEGLNRAITKEFAPKGIRCNIVHPSLIDTDLLKSRHPDSEKRKALANSVPLRRLGRPEDISSAVMFLLSDLSSYITGQSLFVDGGRTFCT